MAAKSKITTNKLDTLFSRIVRMKGRCSYCGKDQRLQCAHIISRKYHQIRWDLNNAIPLCSSCHVRFTFDPLGWELYIERSFGKEYYLALREKAQKIGKLDHNQIYKDLLKYEELFSKRRL